MNTDRQDRMRQALNRLAGQPGVIGATLITRDGLCVMNCDEKILSPATFSAMSATLVGAAETAFYELGGAKQLRVIAESNNTKMIALGATEELLLIMVANGKMTLGEAVKCGEASAAELRTLLGGN